MVPPLLEWAIPIFGHQDDIVVHRIPEVLAIKNMSADGRDDQLLVLGYGHPTTHQGIRIMDI